MGFDDVAAFEAEYRAALALVQGYYAELFTAGETLGAAGGNLVFTGSDDDPATLETLAKMGFHDPAAVSATVRKWHYGSYAATRAAASRAHLTELLRCCLRRSPRRAMPISPSPDSTISCRACRPDCSSLRCCAIMANCANCWCN